MGEDFPVSSYMSSITHWPSSSALSPSTFGPYFLFDIRSHNLVLLFAGSARHARTCTLIVRFVLPILFAGLPTPRTKYYTTDACSFLQFLLFFFRTQSWGGGCWIYHISIIRREDKRYLAQRTGLLLTEEIEFLERYSEPLRAIREDVGSFR